MNNGLALAEYLRTLTAVTNVATGGIYALEELGQEGLKPKNPACPNAFENRNGLMVLKPCIVTSYEDVTPRYTRMDRTSLDTGMTADIDIDFYASDGHKFCRDVANAVFKAVQLQVIPDVGLITHSHTMTPRYDMEWGDLPYITEVYRLKYIRTV